MLSSDQRLSMRPKSKYVYPDVTVICGPVQLEEGTRDGAAVEVDGIYEGVFDLPGDDEPGSELTY